MCSWARNSECGRATTALAMLASPAAALNSARRAGWPLRLVEPLRRRESLGLNGRLAQEPTWKGLEGFATTPSEETTLALTDIAAQLVGLRVKSGRSTSTWIVR